MLENVGQLLEAILAEGPSWFVKRDLPKLGNLRKDNQNVRENNNLAERVYVGND